VIGCVCDDNNVCGMWRLKGGEEGNSFLSAATISKTTSGFRSIPISLHERYYPVLCCAMLGWAGLGWAGLCWAAAGRSTDWTLYDPAASCPRCLMFEGRLCRYDEHKLGRKGLLGCCKAGRAGQGIV
jgi:hypothetical protein